MTRWPEIRRPGGMRVLVIATCPFPAGRGSQLLIERTARCLMERGHAVRVLAPRLRELGRSASFPIERAGLRHAPRPVRSAPEPARLLDDALLLRRAAASGADVILGHNADGGVIAGLVARMTQAASVYVRHSDTAAELSYYGPSAGAVGQLLDRSALGLADRVVELAAVARTHDLADAIPPPLDPHEAEVAPADGLTLYYEGNLDAYQNPAWLQAALSRARGLDPGVRLVVAASPADRPAHADLALLPRALAGGFPMKLLTYQACGIPAVCVASGAPGVEDGRDAFVVAGRGSADAFAARVVEALCDPAARQQIRRQARSRALERHAPRRVGALLEASLERAVQARHERLAGRGQSPPY